MQRFRVIGSHGGVTPFHSSFDGELTDGLCVGHLSVPAVLFVSVLVERVILSPDGVGSVFPVGMSHREKKRLPLAHPPSGRGCETCHLFFQMLGQCGFIVAVSLRDKPFVAVVLRLQGSVCVCGQCGSANGSLIVDGGHIGVFPIVRVHLSECFLGSLSSKAVRRGIPDVAIGIVARGVERYGVVGREVVADACRIACGVPAFQREGHPFASVSIGQQIGALGLFLTFQVGIRGVAGVYVVGQLPQCVEDVC